MDIVIRPETSADFPAVREVLDMAFPDEDVAGLAEALRGSAEYIPELALVAVSDGAVIGHIMFTTSYVDDAGESVPALTLGPLAVHPARQRQGVGSQLVEEGLSICRRLGHRIVVLIGHPTYYPRLVSCKQGRLASRCLSPCPKRPRWSWRSRREPWTACGVWCGIRRLFTTPDLAGLLGGHLSASRVLEADRGVDVVTQQHLAGVDVA